VKNQILEAKLQDISVENALFMEKLVVSERLVEEHKTCESKYNACTEERKRFENLLVKESQQTSQLKDELKSVMKDFEGMKDELHKQSSLINEQEIISTSFQEQLSILCSKLVSLSKDMGISYSDEASVLHGLQNKNYAVVVASLEFFQQQAYQKVLHLHHEKEALEEMCDVLQKGSHKSGTELLDAKEKLNISERHVGKLQQELQEMEHKFNIISGAQEKHSITNGDLTSKLAQMEVELQIVISENETLVEKTKDIAAVVQELERTKVNLAESDEDNKTLAQSLQSKDELLVHMENEIRGLQNCLSCSEENLVKEKRMIEDLESALASVTSQLGEKDQVLLSYKEDKTELLHLRDQILDMRKEHSLMQDALSQSEQIKKELSCKNCSLHS
jgi:chromosome segregation ATPase